MYSRDTGRGNSKEGGECYKSRRRGGGHQRRRLAQQLLGPRGAARRGRGARCGEEPRARHERLREKVRLRRGRHADNLRSYIFYQVLGRGGSGLRSAGALCAERRAAAGLGAPRLAYARGLCGALGAPAGRSRGHGERSGLCGSLISLAHPLPPPPPPLLLFSLPPALLYSRSPPPVGLAEALGGSGGERGRGRGRRAQGHLAPPPPPPYCCPYPCPYCTLPLLGGAGREDTSPPSSSATAAI